MKTHSYLRCVILAFGISIPQLNAQVFSLDNSFEDVVYGDATSMRLGFGTANAGDVNGDGYDDLLAGGYYSSGILITTVDLYYGSAEGITTTSTWHFESAGFPDATAAVADGAGDVNGDGYDDIIIGCENDNAVKVFYGSVSGLMATPDFEFSGGTASGVGGAVSNGGDINGDGFDDVLFTATNPAYTGAGQGAIYIMFGSAGGLSFSNYKIISNSLHETGTFAFSIDAAGDVNGDGYDDIITGNPGYSEYSPVVHNDIGRASLYYGRFYGADTIPVWTKTYIDAYDYDEMGYSVSTAGDVNNDGYADVIIGAPYWANSTTGGIIKGRVYVFLGSASGLPAIEHKIYSGTTNEYRGFSVGCAGDINNDGFDDIIYGAPKFSASGSFKGTAFVHAGSAVGLKNAVYYQKTGSQAGANLGYEVCGNMDINGDGISDIAFGAYLYDGLITDEGAVHITYGTTGSFPLIGDQFIESNIADHYLGWPVSNAGDVNADGFDDLIIGSRSYSGEGPDLAGRFSVYLGSSSGINPVPVYTQTGTEEVEYAGFSVSEAGDVNGDGYDDVIASTMNYVGDDGYEGKVDLFYGSSSGISALNKWTKEGNLSNSSFGSAVAGGGDMNGDGFDDIIICDSYYSNGQTDEGIIYLHYGSATGIHTMPDWQFESNQASTNFGAYANLIGDINNDGYDDFAVAAITFDNGQTDEGKIFIFLGNPILPAAAPDYSIESNKAYSELQLISSKGDINDDGYSDLFIGSLKYDSPASDAGVVWGYYGANAGITDVRDWTLPGTVAFGHLGATAELIGDINHDGYDDLLEAHNQIVSIYHGSAMGLFTTAAETYTFPLTTAGFGTSVANAGDINGDGYTDLLISAASYSGGQSQEGALFLFYGEASYCDQVDTIQADSINFFKIYLSWTATDSALRYDIRYRITGDEIWTLASSSIPSFILSDLPEGTEYEVQIQSVCKVGSAPWSEIFAFSTLSEIPECTELETEGLTVSSITTTGATFTWDAIPGFDNYVFSYRKSGVLAWTDVPVSGNSIILSDLETCNTFEYKVALMCETDTGIYTASGVVTLLCSPCYLAPAGLSAGNITTSKAKISWTAVPSATSYKVYYKKSGTWLKKSSSTTSANLTLLTSASTYQYKVVAICPGGIMSPYTDIKTFTTLPLRLDEESAENYTLNIYPNPAGNYIIISADIFSDSNIFNWNIHDINGKELVTGKFNSAEEENIYADVSAFPSGVYLFTIITSEGPLFQKFMVE